MEAVIEIFLLIGVVLVVLGLVALLLVEHRLSRIQKELALHTDLLRNIAQNLIIQGRKEGSVTDITLGLR